VGRIRPRSARGRLQAKPEPLCFFVIPVMHQVLYRDDGSPRFRRQTVKVEVKTGAIVKNSGILQCGRSQIQNSIFSRFRIPSTVLCTAYRKQFYFKPMVPWKAETLMVCLLLVWTVCDQAFGRYRPLNGAKSGHVTITKNENLHTDTRKKFSDSKNAILFDLRRKITKLSRKNRCRTVASPGACERLAVLN